MFQTNEGIIDGNAISRINSLKQKHLNRKKLGIKRFIGFCIFLFISVIIFTVILFLLEKFK